MKYSYTFWSTVTETSSLKTSILSLDIAKYLRASKRPYYADFQVVSLLWLVIRLQMIKKHPLDHSPMYLSCSTLLISKVYLILSHV